MLTDRQAGALYTGPILTNLLWYFGRRGVAGDGSEILGSRMHNPAGALTKTRNWLTICVVIRNHREHSQTWHESVTQTEDDKCPPKNMNHRHSWPTRREELHKEVPPQNPFGAS